MQFPVLDLELVSALQLFQLLVLSLPHPEFAERWVSAFTVQFMQFPVLDLELVSALQLFQLLVLSLPHPEFAERWVSVDIIFEYHLEGNGEGRLCSSCVPCASTNP